MSCGWQELLPFWVHGGSTPGRFLQQYPPSSNIVPALVSSLMNVGEDLMDLFFIAVTTFFMLLEAPRVIQRVEAMLHDEPVNSGSSHG